MVTVTQKKPAVKPCRSVVLVSPTGPGVPGVMRITVGKDADSYLVRPVAAVGGRAFELAKVLRGPGEEATVAERYHVLIDREGGLVQCECKGFLRHGTECKHLFACERLSRRGLI